MAWSCDKYVIPILILSCLHFQEKGTGHNYSQPLLGLKLGIIDGLVCEHYEP